jgi:hypothetical protein
MGGFLQENTTNATATAVVVQPKTALLQRSPVAFADLPARAFHNLKPWIISVMGMLP